MNIRFQRREEVLFVDVTLWSRLTEIAEQYLQKGSTVFVEGRLQLDTWVEKQSGQKRSGLRVIGENLQILGRPESGEKPAGAESAARPSILLTNHAAQSIAIQRPIHSML